MSAPRKPIALSAATLRVLAMVLMLCDHTWALLLPGEQWLTCVGRLAFPIFAFLLTEGFFHTRSLRRYCLRMLFWAVVTEIPFNLMMAGAPLYPYHQNVLWTFLIALLLMAALDQVRQRCAPLPSLLLCALLTAAGFLAGYLTMADYYGVGVLTVLVFYFFRGCRWWDFLGQLVCLYLLHVQLLGGYFFTITLFGREFGIVQQGLALLALLPIWLYRGRQGYHARWFQHFGYAFYPLHMLVLYAIYQLVTA